MALAGTFNNEKALLGVFSDYCNNYRKISLTPLIQTFNFELDIYKNIFMQCNYE